ncbi:Inner membrane transport protein YdhP [Paenibacillus plantiphilus]|uniref:Inner membrane transport protein YdhP n=1 Tax=Paenibacillus plantiphilus TaxID=2905650 RepID=A0ABN8GCX1_9BACL|nr:MFS transporter [Paenibacillus plantiphilus]CAH1202504.1 Inner membrane transport protein YdhP [Paenibacillus plantiphilus]
MKQLQKQDTKTKRDRFPIALISLTCGAFAIGMTEFVIMGLLLNISEDLHVTISEAGQLITSYALGVAIGAPILAVATHRLPQKKLLCLLMVIFIIGNGIAAIAPNYTILMGARLLTALAHGTFFGVGSVIAARLVSPNKQAAAVSIMMAGLTIANIIGVPFGTFIGQHLGWRSSFGAVVIMGIISLIGILALVPVIPKGQQTGIMRQFRALAQPKLLLVLLTGAIGCSSLFTVFTYIAPLLQHVTGFSEGNVTWILVLFGIGVTAGNIIGGKLADWKLMPVIIGSFAALALILGLFTFTVEIPPLAVATVFIWGVVSFAVLPGLQVRIMRLGKDAPALASTSNHSALNLGNAGGAFLGGAVITQIGLAALPWVGALLSLLGLLLALWVSVLDRRTAST